MGQFSELLERMNAIHQSQYGMLASNENQDAALVVCSYLNDYVEKLKANPPKYRSEHGDMCAAIGVRLTQVKVGISLQSSDKRTAWENLSAILEHLPMSLVWDTTIDDWEISTYTTS